VTEEITMRQKLAEVCARRGEKASIAKAFNVHPSTVARWLEGGEIPPPMLRLLDWYLFGIVPPRLPAAVGLRGTLEFDEAEWRIVRILAQRAGHTPEKWIASTIRTHVELYLAKPPILKVAEDPAEYGKK
jgi:hypothetical protein